MRQAARDFGRRVLAILVLAVAAWLLFKVVLSVVTTVAWIVAGVVALVGVLWALSVLRR